jgi:hypothetical protein
VEGRHLGFPCFPYSVISMACFGNAFHKFTIRSEGPFWEQEPLVRDGDFSAMWLLNTSGPGDSILSLNLCSLLSTALARTCLSSMVSATPVDCDPER